MKTVLMVAYYFPPLSTSGAMRPLAFCRHLPAWGWAPRVVAADPGAVTPSLPTDDGLAGRVPGSVAVERVSHPTPLASLVRLRDAVRRRRSGAGPPDSDPHPHGAVGPRRTLVRECAEFALEHLFLVPDAQRWWYRHAVSAGLRGGRPDVVYATGGPWTALLVGRALARRFRVPFVADFRDPWTRNPFRTYLPLVGERSRWLERSVCRSAARVVANTVELRKQFEADYPELPGKFVAISNGYDDTSSPADPMLSRPSVAGADCGSTALGLWHFGTVYGRRKPDALLKAVSGLLADGRIRAGSLRIHFVGAWELPDDAPSSQLARSLEAAGIVARQPQVPHEMCLEQMRQAQALLVLQPDSPLQVPAKIFDYLLARRPLLVIGGEGATAALVTRHGLGRCSVNEVGPIAALLEELTRGAELAAPATAAIRRFDYRCLTGQLADVFESALRGSRPRAVAS